MPHFSNLESWVEVINDLLDPTGQNLHVREDAQGTYVEGIKEEVILSLGHALSFIAAGEEHPHVGSNNFNPFSSRSHTIFTGHTIFTLLKVGTLGYRHKSRVINGIEGNCCWSSFCKLSSVN